MADDPQAAANIPEGATPPDGYVHVFGPLWISKTTLAPLEKAKNEFKDVDFTNVGCETALSAMRSASQALKDALAMPQQLANQAKSLMDAAADMVEAPFSEVKRAMDSALNSLNNISNAMDELVGGSAGDAKNALEKALECPFVGGSGMGSAIEGLLDKMEEGGDIAEKLDDLKKQLSSQVGNQLNAIKDTPLESLRNSQKLLDDMLDRLDVSSLVKQLGGLEKCVEAACDMAKVAEKLPERASDLMDSIGGVVDSATGKVSAVLASPKNAAQEAVAGTLDRIESIASRVEPPVILR